MGGAGAGKTSVINTIFRLMELDQGGIFIDGMEIAKLGLGQLGNAIIPQVTLLLHVMMSFLLFLRQPLQHICDGLSNNAVQTRFACFLFFLLGLTSFWLVISHSCHYDGSSINVNMV